MLILICSRQRDRCAASATPAALHLPCDNFSLDHSITPIGMLTFQQGYGVSPDVDKSCLMVQLIGVNDQINSAHLKETVHNLNAVGAEPIWYAVTYSASISLYKKKWGLIFGKHSFSIHNRKHWSPWLLGFILPVWADEVCVCYEVHVCHR